jgi:hypothetical protein
VCKRETEDVCVAEAFEKKKGWKWIHPKTKETIWIIMLKLGDIGVLAEAIEKSLPEIAKKNGGEDIRHSLKVSVQVSREELDGINKELYEMVNHRLPDQSLEADMVELELVGISFGISSEPDFLG